MCLSEKFVCVCMCVGGNPTEVCESGQPQRRGVGERHG